MHFWHKYLLKTVYLDDIELTKIIVTVARNVAILKLIFNLKVKCRLFRLLLSQQMWFTVKIYVCYQISTECLKRSDHYCLILQLSSWNDCDDFNCTLEILKSLNHCLEQRKPFIWSLFYHNWQFTVDFRPPKWAGFFFEILVLSKK